MVDFRVGPVARVALLFAAALVPELATALDGTYTGTLEPESREANIPIVVELRDRALALQGTVTISGPQQLRGSIEGSKSSFGQCTVNVELSPALALRMVGPCDAASFSGTYSLTDRDKKTITFGSFKLPQKSPGAAKGGSKRAPPTTASCLDADAQCVLACPRTEESIEVTCLNRCRTKLQACKTRVKKATLPDAG
ncbi:MAG TPA: hypothetical protein VMU96_04970 [Casimicrobiaceae bacterium]|nr:hypothetical protein [Casimicrobiaceae bacterium]